MRTSTTDDISIVSQQDFPMHYLYVAILVLLFKDRSTSPVVYYVY